MRVQKYYVENKALLDTFFLAVWPLNLTDDLEKQ